MSSRKVYIPVHPTKTKQAPRYLDRYLGALLCLILSGFFLTGCAATDAELFKNVLHLADVNCGMPTIKTSYMDGYVPWEKTVHLKPEHRYDDGIRLHELMHHVSMQCLTAQQKEELLGRYAEYFYKK